MDELERLQWEVFGDEGEQSEDESDKDDDSGGDIVSTLTTQFISESNEWKWLLKHGKQDMIDFDDEQRKVLQECFDSLDDDGSKSIGVEELEDPLIALGLVENR